MLTKKVKSRVYLISLILVSISIALFFILRSLNNNILYFKTPSDIKLEKTVNYNKIRIGGINYLVTIPLLQKKWIMEA